MEESLQSHISLISADKQNNKNAEVKAQVVVLVMDMFT